MKPAVEYAEVAVAAGPDALEAVEPTEGAFDAPTSLVAAKFSPVGPASPSVAAMRSNQVGSALKESRMQRSRLVALVADQARDFSLRRAVSAWDAYSIHGRFGAACFAKVRS